MVVTKDSENESSKIKHRFIQTADLYGFVTSMVIYTARDKRTPKKKQEEVNEWIGFFVKLVNEFQTKRYF